MTEYKFDAVRWCKSRARTARAQRNFADENSFVQVAREIEELMARLAEVEAQRDVAKTALAAIADSRMYGVCARLLGEIRDISREALAKLEAHDGK